jgi:hypothetical protein
MDVIDADFSDLNKDEEKLYRELALKRRLVNEFPELSEADLLTPIQLSLLLGVSKNTLSGWRIHGGGPKFTKLEEKVIRYKWADVLIYVRSLGSFQNTGQSELHKKAAKDFSHRLRRL